MKDIIKQDIKESLEWFRNEMKEHGFDTNTPIQDMETFFQAQEATENMLEDEICDIANEYGDDSLEVEAAEDLQNDVEEGFNEVGETTAEDLKRIEKLQNENVEEIFKKLYEQNQKLQKQTIALEEKINSIEHGLNYKINDIFNYVGKTTSYAKNFAIKTFDNVKQFCNDRKQDIFYAVDMARMKQANILKDFYMETRSFTIENQKYCEDWNKRISDLAHAKALAKAAKGNVFNKILTPFYKGVPIYEKLIPKEVDLNTVTGEKTALGKLAKLFKKEANIHEEFLKKQDNKLVSLDEKMKDISNKWQDKAKEPSQKSFEENMRRAEKEAEMENQNINPQRTQSQER